MSSEISVRLPLSRYQQLLEHERAYLAGTGDPVAHEHNILARLYNLRGGKTYTLGRTNTIAPWCLHVSPFNDPGALPPAALVMDATDAQNLAVAAFIITGQAWKRSWLLKVSENARAVARV